jgi:hypothetical protein
LRCARAWRRRGAPLRRGGRRARGFRDRIGRLRRPAEREPVARSPFGKVNGVGESLPLSSSPPRAGYQAGWHSVDPPRDGIEAYDGSVVNVVNVANGKPWESETERSKSDGAGGRAVVFWRFPWENVEKP